MTIKNIIITSLICLSLTACGHNNNKHTTMQSTTTYTQQDILNLYQTVQHFEEETHKLRHIKKEMVNNCKFCSVLRSSLMQYHVH